MTNEDLTKEYSSGRINALFVENKHNLGSPQFAGYVNDFADDMPELVAYALPNFFEDKKECSTFAKKLRDCFDSKEDKDGFFDAVFKTDLYGIKNVWKIKKNDITVYLMKNLPQLMPLKP